MSSENAGMSRSVIYTLDELRTHYNKDKERSQKRFTTENDEHREDLLYDEDGNIIPFNIYQKLLVKK